MKNSRQSYINTHRDSWVEINLGYLAENMKAIKELLPEGVRLLGVIKADAYGHGAVMCAPTMLAAGADMLGVASIDEGLNLRDSKITCDILVLGAVPIWSFEIAAQNDIAVSIFSPAHIEACRQTFERTGKKILAHVKVDTGMNRIGVRAEQAVEFIEQVRSCDFIELKGVFTHLANAENEQKTMQQFEKWNSVISKINSNGLLLHILNTAGIFTYPIKSDMVRAGVAIYGLYPDLLLKSKRPALKQILSLKGRITNIHEAFPDEGVSYGHTFNVSKPVKIATIPIGYADGVPRALSNKIFAKLNGQKIKQIGNITMYQMMFDISGLDAKEGDIITLLDEEFSIDSWAKILGTINYELPCRLKVRLPRVYTR